MNYNDTAPAFQLVRAGYDVWLGNQRGTKYSLEHTSLNYKRDKAYWEFSFTEMGEYDAPAQIDYVRNTTGIDKVTYMGHSQGTSQMFYAVSAHQEFWKERLNLWIALAPVTKLDHTKSDLFLLFAQFTSIIQEAANLLHVWSILGGPSNAASKLICGTIPDICLFGESFLITQDPSLDDKDRFAVYMSHFPAGASVQSLVHYGQIINSKSFRLYDWGQKKNVEKYGQGTPPDIDLTRITELPTAMFVGTQDDLGDVTDC